LYKPSEYIPDILPYQRTEVVSNLSNTHGMRSPNNSKNINNTGVDITRINVIGEVEESLSKNDSNDT